MSEPPFIVPRELLRYFGIKYVCYLCGAVTASLIGCWAHLEEEHHTDIFAVGQDDYAAISGRM
jgi:hypothetical protein